MENTIQKKNIIMQKLIVVVGLATICDLLWGSAFPFIKLGYQVLIGGIFMSAVGFVAGGRLTVFTAKGGIILLYLAFISAMAYSLWATLLAYNPISKVAVMGFLNPVFGVILSAIILKEGNVVNFRSIIALVLVCIGICVVYRKKEQ